jgi:MFS transporter, NNP family, nitrate/nitrite transporter
MATSSAKTRPFPLGALLFLSGLLYLNFTGRIILAPLLPVLETELGLGHGAAGSLFFFQAVGYAFGLLAAGLTAWRLSHHGTIVLSALTLGATLLALSSTPTLGWMRACLVLIGVGAGLYLPSGIATIADLAPEAQWGRATAIHEFAPAIGFITAPLVAEALLHWLSWRAVLGTFGMALLVAGLLYGRWGQGGRQRAEPPHLHTMVVLATDGALARIAVLFTLAVAVGYGLYAMLPLFLIAERGMDRASANALVGLSRTLAPPMILAAGWLADRLGHRRALAAFQGITGGLTVVLAVAHGPMATGAVVVLQAAASTCFFPAYYPLVAQIVPPSQRHLAVSVVSVAGMFLGGGLTPSLIGYFAEVRSFAGAILFVGVLTLASPALFLLDYRGYGGRVGRKAGG